MAVEIISEGEDPHATFALYAAVNTREVLVVERDPWAAELFTLLDGQLVSTGRSDVGNGGRAHECRSRADIQAFRRHPTATHRSDAADFR